MVKTCSKCRESKPVSEFYARAAARDGLLSRCKGCMRSASAEWKRKNPERVAAYNKQKWDADPDGARNRIQAWRDANPEKVVAQRRRGNLRRYGLTPEQYAMMYLEQDEACAICLAPSPSGPLHVDHDHVTGAVRQLLCTCCNTALGKFRESPEILARALEYLERHASVAHPAA
jgi:hypothetical protein